MKANATFCFWSVATGKYCEWMERCVSSARGVGISNEFHVLADRPISGCETYDAMHLELSDGMFKFVYLKAGISKLGFDYYVWIDADSLFRRNPTEILLALKKSPVHVPLGDPISLISEDSLIRGVTAQRYEEVMVRAGIMNEVYVNRSAFWIVKREAVDVLCALAQRYLAFALKSGIAPHADAALGFAMQMLCADPQSHRQNANSALWSSDDEANPRYLGAKTDAFNCFHSVPPSAAIVHLPRLRRKEIG